MFSWVPKVTCRNEEISILENHIRRPGSWAEAGGTIFAGGKCHCKGFEILARDTWDETRLQVLDFVLGGGGGG